MRYVALLRGINVGGNAKVEMPRLKTLIEKLGCKDVSTYINSGNVIFTDDRTDNILSEIIENAIEKEFGFKVPIVIRDQHNIADLCRKIPIDWTNDKNLKTDVMFLWDEVDNPDILNKIKVNPDIEKAIYFKGALIWSVSRQFVTRGGGIKLIKTDVYKHMTIRNINTVRKINELLQK